MVQGLAVSAGAAAASAGDGMLLGPGAASERQGGRANQWHKEAYFSASSSFRPPPARLWVLRVKRQHSVQTCRYADMEDIELALANGAPVDSKDGQGRTGEI